MKFIFKKISCLPTKYQPNEYKVLLPRDKYGTVDVNNGIYDMNNKPKKEMFNYEKEGRLCLDVAKVEILDWKITGESFTVFDFTWKGGSPLMLTRKKYYNIYQEE